jgi:hypothetical protein
VFDDTRPTGKLRIHDKGFHWADGVPIPAQRGGGGG